MPTFRFFSSIGFVELLTFMDVPGGFAPAIVAAFRHDIPETVSTGAWNYGLRF